MVRHRVRSGFKQKYDRGMYSAGSGSVVVEKERRDFPPTSKSAFLNMWPVPSTHPREWSDTLPGSMMPIKSLLTGTYISSRPSLEWRMKEKVLMFCNRGTEIYLQTLPRLTTFQALPPCLYSHSTKSYRPLDLMRRRNCRQSIPEQSCVSSKAGSGTWNCCILFHAAILRHCTQ